MNERRMLVAAVLSVLTAAPWAQTVYESQGKDGPSFSDVPSPGASAVELPPPNVVSAPPVPKPQPPVPAKALAPYRSLRITAPAAQGMVHTNTGAFDVVAQLQPPLRPGDRVLVRLDGNALQTVFRSTRLHLSEADWQGAAAVDTDEHTLQLAIVDATGQVRIESDAVRFYARREATGGRRGRR